MDADAARARATEMLRVLEQEGDAQPLMLIAPDAPSEYEWCWLYPFNTVLAVQNGTLMDALATGPVVVPKNGGVPWIAPSSPPVEQWLNRYATEVGLPQVPVPALPNPFA